MHSQKAGQLTESVSKCLMPDEHGLSPVAAEVHYLIAFRELHFTYLAKVVTTVS